MRRRVLPSLSHYTIDVEGRVYHRTRNCAVAQHLNDEGYPRVKLRGDDGRWRNYLVHRLVAQAFLPPPSEDQRYVLHRRNNRLDACVDNLYWGTHADNHADKRSAGTLRPTSRKLTRDDVRKIRRSTLGTKQLAVRLGLSISHVREIRNGRRWRRA